MNVMVDIYQQERVEVRYSKVLSKHNRADLTNPDSTVKNTYAKYMDRILSAVGFKCAATSTDGKEDSHMAVMTAISDFCEQADPLNGSRKKIMHGHAMSMLTSAELEAQDRFVSFLTSKNPAAPFPGPYLAEGSPTKTLLAKKFTQLRSILDLQGFDDSILNTGAVTLSGTVHATMHTRLGLFNTACLAWVHTFLCTLTVPSLTSNALVGDGPSSCSCCIQLRSVNRGSCRTLIQHMHPVCTATWHCRCSKLPVVATLPNLLGTP